MSDNICTQCNENEAYADLKCWTCLFVVNGLELELTLDWK